MTSFKRIVINTVPARCAHTRESFNISARKKPGKIILLAGQAVSSTDIVPFSHSLAEKENKRAVMSGKISIDSGYCCPICSNKSIVRCKKCGFLSCYDDSGYFVCAHCSAMGTVANNLKRIPVYS